MPNVAKHRCSRLHRSASLGPTYPLTMNIVLPRCTTDIAWCAPQSFVSESYRHLTLTVICLMPCPPALGIESMTSSDPPPGRPCPPPKKKLLPESGERGALLATLFTIDSKLEDSS